MTCPVCGGKCLVTDSRGDCEVIYRKRVCIECEHDFYTEEREGRNTKDDYIEFRREYHRGIVLKRIARRAKK
jgi:transcriptional regulator NrdR family protein